MIFRLYYLYFRSIFIEILIWFAIKCPNGIVANNGNRIWTMIKYSIINGIWCVYDKWPFYGLCAQFQLILFSSIAKQSHSTSIYELFVHMCDVLNVNWELVVVYKSQVWSAYTLMMCSSSSTSMLWFWIFF